MAISEELRNEIISRIDKVIGFTPEKDSLFREGKDFSYSPIKDKVEWFFAKAGIIKNSISEVSRIWPDQKVREYCSEFDQVIAVLERIKSFSPEQITSPGQERDNQIAQVESLYTQYFSKWQADSYPFEVGPSVSQEAVNRILQDVTTKKAEIETILRNSQEVFRSIQDAAATTGVQKYQTIFGDQADEYKRGGDRWLKTMIGGFFIAACLLVWFFWAFLNEIRNAKDTTNIIQILTAKLVIISVIFYILHWISRNYSAQRHLETLYRQREKSLQVFKAFVDATEEKEIKDQVLQIAAKSIFENRETGYISSQDDGGTNIELLDRLLPKK